MILFDNKSPFSIKIYFNEKDWNFENDSNEIPVFHTPPLHSITHPFGLCVYNMNDVRIAQKAFGQNISSNQSTTFNFLYIMGDACRQTDTLELASQTGYPLIIEKGPFLSPDDIKRMISKLTHTNFAIVECGSSFGYADRVLDPKSLFALKEVSPYFGVCISDLLKPQGEVYAHRAEWLSNGKFTQAFDLAVKNFQPNFYVYKMDPKVQARDEHPISPDDNSTPWDETDIFVSSRGVELSSGGSTAGSSSAFHAQTPQTFAGGWDGAITPNIKLNRDKLTVIAGPCMLETLEIGLEVGRFMKNLCEKLGYQYIFKSSFDKANRTSANGARGPGLEQGVKWLEQIKQELNVPILTDVHSAEQAQKLSHVVDVLQIPAFLFREKKLLLACAQTEKVLQIKKGQWASAQDMLNVASFLAENNFHKVILAERGSCFGYNNLVVDFRNLVDMAEHKNAVVFDATHAVQLPGAKNGKSSGLRHMVPALTRAAIAIGIDGLFMEVHPNPTLALSDADTQLSFDMACEILTNLYQF